MPGTEQSSTAYERVQLRGTKDPVRGCQQSVRRGGPMWCSAVPRVQGHWHAAAGWGRGRCPPHGAVVVGACSMTHSLHTMQSRGYVACAICGLWPLTTEKFYSPTQGYWAEKLKGTPLLFFFSKGSSSPFYSNWAISCHKVGKRIPK